ncbi:MAG: DMT family transporter [Cellvibrionales bacterium]|nr:DMT family transporter [Cellvibrionales bacterium]
MPVIITFFTVLTIWSTTPLAIQISHQSMSNVSAVAFRMLLAFIITGLAVAILRPQSALKVKNLPLYLSASIALFPSMSVVYFASTFINSGLIAVMFSLTPVISGFMAWVILKEPLFLWNKMVALGLAIAGSAIIFLDDVVIDSNAVKGLGLMLVSNTFFCLSQVLTKKSNINRNVDAMEQTLGAIFLSLPGLFLCWWVFDGVAPINASDKSLWALVYLAVIGSFVGFIAYYHLLSKVSVAVISVIPLITPVLSLILGALVNDEQITENIMMGCLLIVCGLAIYDEALVNKLKAYFGKLRMNGESAG